MPPEEARLQLARGAEHQGIQLGSQQIDQLLAHLSLLERWGKTYNLTAIRDPAQMITQHVIDSLALAGALRRHLGDASSARLLDVGSGAGFPGLPLAIAMPQLDVICVDSVGKKVGFIRQAVAELGLPNIRAEHARVERLEALDCDLITSRAFASLGDFVQLSRPHLKDSGCWVAMKGQQPIDELAALSPKVDVFHVEQLSIPGLHAERCLVWMRPLAG